MCLTSCKLLRYNVYLWLLWYQWNTKAKKNTGSLLTKVWACDLSDGKFKRKKNRWRKCREKSKGIKSSNVLKVNASSVFLHALSSNLLWVALDLWRRRERKETVSLWANNAFKKYCLLSPRFSLQLYMKSVINTSSFAVWRGRSL